MADSSARNILYGESELNSQQRETQVLVTDPRQVPWSKLEKFLVAAGVLVVLALMAVVTTVSVSSTSAQHTLANVQQSLAQNQNKTTDLRQEIGELTSSSRLNEIAQKQGLTLRDGNIKTVR